MELSPTEAAVMLTTSGKAELTKVEALTGMLPYVSRVMTRV
jgi:hypothetical protein